MTLSVASSNAPLTEEELQISAEAERQGLYRDIAPEALFGPKSNSVLAAAVRKPPCFVPGEASRLPSRNRRGETKRRRKS